jgi:hypothetical protein
MLTGAVTDDRKSISDALAYLHIRDFQLILNKIHIKYCQAHQIDNNSNMQNRLQSKSFI